MPSGAAPVVTTVSSLAELYKKTNTAVKVALKRKTEEYDWFDDYPDELITPSGNEMRIVLDVMYQPDTTAMIPDGGYEAQLTTMPPQHGIFTFVQANFRYSFTTLEQAFDRRGRAGMIQQQTLYSAIKAVENFARKIGKQTYGMSTGTVAMVGTTAGAAGTVQAGVRLINGYGSTLIPGGTTSSNTYLSNLFRNGDPIALIRGGNLVEFGQVTSAPSIASGVGFIDTVFNTSITPTANDLIVPAAAVIDGTITATDTNRWPVGFLDGMTSASVHGLATAVAPNWKSNGYTAGGRFSYALQEWLINQIWNNGGVKMDRLIMSQGVRRDVIAGERAALRYNDETKFNLNGDIGTDGIKYMTSVLAPPGLVLGWNSDCITQKILSDKPDYEGGPSMFDLDKIQDRGAYAASYNFVYAKIWGNRAGTGYLANLTEQP